MEHDDPSSGRRVRLLNARRFEHEDRILLAIRGSDEGGSDFLDVEVTAIASPALHLDEVLAGAPRR